MSPASFCLKKRANAEGFRADWAILGQIIFWSSGVRVFSVVSVMVTLLAAYHSAKYDSTNYVRPLNSKSESIKLSNRD